MPGTNNTQDNLYQLFERNPLSPYGGKSEDDLLDSAGPKGDFELPPVPDPILGDTGIAPEERARIAANYDSDVAQRWANFQGANGLGPDSRTQYPPNYKPAAQRIAESQKDRGILHDIHDIGAGPDLAPDNPPDLPAVEDYPSYKADQDKAAQHQQNLAQWKREGVQEVSQPPSQPAQPSTPTSGSYSVSASSQGFPLLRNIMQDYNEQLQGMANEGQARQDLANDQYQRGSQLAGYMRDTAQEERQNQLGQFEDARRHLDEIGQLASDYANREIDPDKWWKERSVPQRIAVVVGAMFSGIQGGAKQGVDFVNNLIDRSIALQQGSIQQEGRALYEADNLFQNFLKISGNEQEAYDKTRAAMLDAAMTDAHAAAAKLQGGVQSAQMQQFMAALKLQRDTLLAKLSASASGAGPGNGWLAIEPQQLVPGLDGQNYLINNKSLGDDVTNMLTSFQRIKEGLAQGQEVLARRGATDYVNPFSENIRQGEAVDGAMAEAVAKLASARGVPTSVLATIRAELPQFGSRTAAINVSKVGEVNKLLDSWSRDALKQAGAIPVDVTTGGGQGKKAGEWTYYARPSQTGRMTPQAQTTQNQRQYGSFKPQGQ